MMTRLGRLAALVLLAVMARAHATESVPPSMVEAQSETCRAAVAAAERRWHTPPGLLLAIARAESGRPLPSQPGLQPWPWAMDADGQAMYSDSKDSALTWTRKRLADGALLVDVGCMQINLELHPEAFGTLDAAFDPASNADFAARFLVSLAREAGGNWYEAVGWYHSRTPDLAAAYRERVAAIAEGRTPPPTAQEPLYMRALQQGTLRLPLVGGGLLLIHVNRQPAASWHRRKTPCQVAAILGPLLSARARVPSCGQKR